MEYTNRQYWNDIIKMSLCKFFILRVLYGQPSYGYEIINQVARLTENFCVPTEGAVYPVLREFERDGCVTSEKQVVNGRERKVYTLTPLGREAFEVGADVWQEATTHIYKASEILDREKAG